MFIFFIKFSLLQKMYLLSLYYLKLNVFFKCLCWYDPICTTLKSWRYHSNMTANQLVDRVSLTWIWGLFWDHARGWCLVIRSAEGTKQEKLSHQSCWLTVDSHMFHWSHVSVWSFYHLLFPLHSHTHHDISTHLFTPEYPEFMFILFFILSVFGDKV